MPSILARLSVCIILSLFMVSCSGSFDKTIDYQDAKQMPGYGYIFMDFRLANEMAYGNGYIPGKTNYTISYKNKGDIFFVDIQHADFRNRILKAYIPYMKGYTLIGIGRSYWYPFFRCDKCDNEPQLKFLYINIVKSVDEAWCSEITYKNLRSFNAMDGCSQMVGVEESRKVTGDVLITPELKSDFQGMFTPYLKPGR